MKIQKIKKIKIKKIKKRLAFCKTTVYNMFCSLDNTADKTIRNALLAQLVEHLTLNQGVQGSNP